VSVPPPLIGAVGVAALAVAGAAVSVIPDDSVVNIAVQTLVVGFLGGSGHFGSIEIKDEQATTTGTPSKTRTVVDFKWSDDAHFLFGKPRPVQVCACVFEVQLPRQHP
jgi:hypothetical protein